MRQVKIGKILLTSGGKWTAGVAYPALTYVTHNGDGWWSKIETLNSEPSDENNMWIKATDVGDYIKQLVSVTDDASAQMQAILEAETKRVEAENERITAEQQRQKDEKARQDAETIRQEEETQRQKDEQSRRNAENERDQSYADAEERRDELFVQREEQRQNAYEIAEQARQDKEAIRERQEATRVSQEEQRQSTFEVAMRNADTATMLATETAEHPTKPGDDFYMYVWDPGTKSYSKTNIFIKGEGFSIYKTYETIALMEADTTNVPDGRFVLISNDNVDDPDNAKLYIKDSGMFRFLVDLSGAVGFSGKTPQLEIGTVTNGGNMGSASASIVRTGTDADGNPTYAINLAFPMLSYDDLTEAQKKELQKPATDMIATLEATNEAVATEEAKRVEAENGRMTAEHQRQKDEEARQDKEAIRERQEATRVSQEEQRQSTFEVAMRDVDAATSLATETAEHPTKPGDDFYMYVWDPGTKSYSKTNIFIKGEGFSIYKTYETIALMEADTDNVPDGRFVLISNDNVDDPDNAKLYVKDSGVFRFLVDMSGAIGFTGKTPQLEIGTVTNGGNMGAASASTVRTGTDADGNPTYAINLALPMVSYDDLTEAQKKELQKPATDMIATLEATNEAVVTEEAKRVEAEAGRVAEWNTIKANVTSTTSVANDAAALANSKATLADTAASNANEKASLADTAASNANEKASMADTAASNANEKAGYAQTQGNYAKEQGDALVNFVETVERSKSTEASLNSLIKNMEEQGHVHAHTLDIDALPTICTFPLFRIEEKDPDVIPDFIGQVWINKEGNTVYIATHCDSAAGYKAI